MSTETMNKFPWPVVQAERGEAVQFAIERTERRAREERGPVLLVHNDRILVVHPMRDALTLLDEWQSQAIAMQEWDRRQKDPEYRLVDRRCRCGHPLSVNVDGCLWHGPAQALYAAELQAEIRRLQKKVGS
jgi:hypothetical protein